MGKSEGDHGEERQESTKPPSLEVQLGNIRVKAEQALSVFAALVGILAVVVTAFIAPSKLDMRASSLISLESIQAQQRQENEEQLAYIKKDLGSVRKDIAMITAVPKDFKIAFQVDQTAARVAALDVRLSKIESVILNDPAKSLEMPLLRNELEYVKKGYQSDLVSLRDEIARIYDLTKWFIGLMFTMALGIIGLAVTNFVKAGTKIAS